MYVKDGYVLRRVGKVGIVVSVKDDNDYIITLNQSGIELWKMLEEETNMPLLVQKMMKKYDVPEDVLEKDIRSFLNKIKRIGLLIE